MRKILLLILFIFTIPIDKANATMVVPIVSGTNAVPSTSVANWTSLYSGQNGMSSTSIRRQVAPSAGTMNNLYVKQTPAPANGAGTQTYTFVVDVNGSSSTLTCTISEAATSCNDTAHPIAIAAGDQLNFKITPAGTPAAMTQLNWSLEVTTADNTSWMLFNIAGTTSTTNTEYLLPNTGSSLDTTETNVSGIVTTAGNFTGIYIVRGTDPGGSASMSYTLMLNGVAQTLTCSIASGSTSCNDTSHSIAVVAGDLISVRTVPTSTPSASTIYGGLLFSPKINGESIIVSNTATSTLTNSAVSYLILKGTVGSNPGESTAVAISPTMTVKNLYVSLSAAPGVGKSYTIVGRKDGASQSLTCAVSGNVATSCNDTTNSFSTTVGSNNLINWMVTPSGTPTAATFRGGATLFVKIIKTTLFKSSIYNSTLN